MVSNADPKDELREHLPALHSFAMSLCGDRAGADDLVQETFIKAWANFDKFAAGTNMRSWLYTILRNSFLSDLRKRKREVSDSDGFYAESLCEAPSHHVRLAFADFRAAFEQLSSEHREVLILTAASGFPHEDVAAMTGVAIGTVKSRVNRARERLCILLGLEKGETLISIDVTTSAVISATGKRAA